MSEQTKRSPFSFSGIGLSFGLVFTIILNPNNLIEKFLITTKDKEDANIHNSKEWFVKPKKNLLLFFPSYLWHAIMNNTSDNPRHSLSFNLIPIGEYGVGDSTYNTNWFK